MNNNQAFFPRDFSSSEDQCRCVVCKNQQDLRMINRNNCTVHFYRQNKRQGPPIKKDVFPKEVSQKAKFIQKRCEQEKKKNKMTQKTKDGLSPAINDYHPVSHSQREKLVKGDFICSQNVERRKRIPQKINIQEVILLPEVSQQPESILQQSAIL